MLILRPMLLNSACTSELLIELLKHGECLEPSHSHQHLQGRNSGKSVIFKDIQVMLVLCQTLEPLFQSSGLEFCLKKSEIH